MIPVFLVFFPMFGGLAAYTIGRGRKNVTAAAGTIVCAIEFLAASFALAAGEVSIHVPYICGRGLNFGLDGFRSVYGVMAAFLWLMTVLFSLQYMGQEKNRSRFDLFHLLTLGAVMGVFLSKDFFTAFIFFEIMSFTSYVWVAFEENRPCLRAAETYLAVAVIGGMVMLMGLFLLDNRLGTLEFDKLLAAAAECEDKGLLYAAGGCILFGFGAKAGMFPLHIWLPKAHPVAPAPASALLSGILTKTGIFGILAVSCNIFLYDKNWGEVVLVLGLITMLLGAATAVFSIDLKRTLACSSMSQIGFVLTGIGMQCILGKENGIAVRGTFLHMINHSLFKLVLFLAAGTIFMNIHRLDLNEIRGYGRKKPLLHFNFLMGALGIAGIPFFSGYVSKTLLHEGILEGIAKSVESALYREAAFLRVAEWMFLISGGMTVCYMAKLYIAVFLEKNTDDKIQEEYDVKKRYMRPASAVALTAGSVLLPVMGVFPHAVMDRLADMGQGFMHLYEFNHSVDYFSLENLKGAFLSIAIGVVLFGAVRVLLMTKKEGKRIYCNRLPKWLDLEDMLYRPVLLKILPFIMGVICRILDSFTDGCILLLRKTVYRDRKIPHERIEGTEFTHVLGNLLDKFRILRYRLRRLELPQDTVSYEHKLAMQREKFVETNTVIARSLSFGLLLFYVGLVFTLIYLLVKG